MIPLRVNDLKQWSYCPRIVFYNAVMPVKPPPSYKMEHGKSQEEWFAALETRRALSKYGLEEGERLFRLSLESKRLGLSGRLDLLIRTRDALYPVDFKFSRQGAFRNHLFQLAGYAVLLEDHFDVPVPHGFVYTIPDKKLHRLELTNQLKSDILQQMETIRAMIAAQDFPEPTPYRQRCYNCEFLNFCGDVL